MDLGGADVEDALREGPFPREHLDHFDAVQHLRHLRIRAGYGREGHGPGGPRNVDEMLMLTNVLVLVERVPIHDRFTQN